MNNGTQNLCDELEDKFKPIDSIMRRIDQYAVGSKLLIESTRRNENAPDFGASDQFVMNRIADIIAYSNGARSENVTEMINSGALQRAFYEFDVVKIANSDQQKILDAEWSNLKRMRFKFKVERIIKCAQVLMKIAEKYGSFMHFLRDSGLPVRIQSQSDLQKFWDGFEKTRFELEQFGMPHVPNLTTFCHLLMDLGFDCIKPDSAVMKASANLKIISPRKDGNYRLQELRRAVEFIQCFALCRRQKPSVVDLYLLIHGGQTDAKPYVRPEYYSN